MRRHDGAHTIKTFNPAAPDEVVAEVSTLSDEEIDLTLNAMAVGVGQWSNLAPLRAAALNGWADSLEADAESLVSLVVREVGKPVQEARAEVKRSVAILRYYAQAAFDPIGEVYPSPDGRASLIAERFPLGIVMAVTPWNFPAAIPVWKVAPALAYGNAVLLKPSSAAVGTAYRLFELAREHIPKNVLALAPVGTEQAQRLFKEPRIAGVSFTGSVTVGQEMIRSVATRGGSVQAEMGGQNPSIVLDDADPMTAATIIARAAMAYAGQKCTATSRVIVARSIATSFIPALVEATSSLPIGDPSREETVVGPLINSGARDDVRAAVRSAVERGAALLVGGDEPPLDGWFYRPALLELTDVRDQFAQEETFGPAAAVIVASSDEEAVEIANATRYGLAAAVFSQDLDRATRVARKLRAGLIRVNASTTGVDFYAPFGGERASSYGPREQGRAAREFYTSSRTILINPA